LTHFFGLHIKILIILKIVSAIRSELGGQLPPWPPLTTRLLRVCIPV